MPSAVWPRAASLCVAALLSVACSRTPAEVRLPDFADLVEEVSPSVVNISTIPAETAAATEAEPGAAEGGAPVPDNLPEWMKRFLEQHAPNGLPPAEEPEESPEDQQSLGSGFVLWKDGYIITNTHVVKDAKEVLVRLSDRRELTATVVGMDEPSDIALLKIDADKLPAVKVAEAGKLRVGQWVMAIGSPFGFDYSVTAGIVSAKGRSLFTEQYVPFIQTDAAINPGNSGGPLFNLKGEVVGVNSQIYSQTGGNSGIAFAIPIEVALRVAEQLKDKGHVTRGWLGVVVQEVTRALAQSFGMARAEGALVAKVIPGSPAEKAGIQPGDVILAFDGQNLGVSSELPPLVGVVDPGADVPLKVLREGKQITVKVEIGELPEEVATGGEAPVRSRLPLGLGVERLSAADRAQARVAEGGVRVLAVEPGPALEAGVREGDVLLTLSGQAIDSAERLKEVVARLAPGSSVPLLIQRDGAPLFLALAVPEAPAEGKK
ncbi:DegQ family serine endoprotease [Stagnimonas aquatica]|uniref:Probable periplasmic serine endoprotease DegP-like n=1 Tax=Stagnimonas aquatica TaxID=2689987 RepID=A0A3N0UZL3_9GAMM|nr:DegQ family serine endoprotease [Stagnimonas aquatica]ROH85960.1 DegQ family serine endoprotease [Stagnimonas aquatica]